MIDAIRRKCDEDGIKQLNDTRFNLTDLIDGMSYKRPDFLTFFTHPKDGGPLNAIGLGIFTKDSLWTESVPHPKFSGKVFKY